MAARREDVRCKHSAPNRPRVFVNGIPTHINLYCHAHKHIHDTCMHAYHTYALACTHTIHIHMHACIPYICTCMHTYLPRAHFRVPAALKHTGLIAHVDGVYSLVRHVHALQQGFQPASAVVPVMCVCACVRVRESDHLDARICGKPSLCLVW